ncbi:MAG: hypothetical protein KC416_03935 [Myxococcales bacterium]|nr:hypothetical protein [Myxococcales bacterium]
MRFGLPLGFFLILTSFGCSILVDSTLSAKGKGDGGSGNTDAAVDGSTIQKDGSTIGKDGGSADGGSDGGTLVSCLGMLDGTVCGVGFSCLGGICSPRQGGDKYIDTAGGEECEEDPVDSDDTDGCTSTCKFTCKTAADCDGFFPYCTGDATCEADHTCKKGTNRSNGTACNPGNIIGECTNGVCVPDDCGNGQLDTGEDCDLSINGTPETSDTCTTDCKWVCIADSDCTDDPCFPAQCTNHACGAPTAIVCTPSDSLCIESTCVNGTCAEKLKVDEDEDGYSGIECKDRSLDEIDGTDCDKDKTRNPGKPEQCDNIDHDCDGKTDNDTEVKTWYRDFDGDGYGLDNTTAMSCSQPNGYVSKKGDCFEGLPGSNAANVNPGQEMLFSKPIREDCRTTLECWDYNCNGKIKKLYEKAEPCSGTFLKCKGGGGFTADVPCGELGTYFTCKPDLQGCAPSSGSKRTQTCN